jgi:hypothetical protein
VWPSGVLARQELELLREAAVEALEDGHDANGCFWTNGDSGCGIRPGCADIDAYCSAVVASGAFDAASELLSEALGEEVIVSWSDDQSHADGVGLGVVYAASDEGYARADILDPAWYWWLLEQLRDEAREG